MLHAIEYKSCAREFPVRFFPATHVRVQLAETFNLLPCSTYENYDEVYSKNNEGLGVSSQKLQLLLIPAIVYICININIDSN